MAALSWRRRRELRRRLRQSVFIVLGLALGVGLVVTVTAVSAGMQRAQGDVLQGLYGIGTDLTVTKAPPRADPAADSNAAISSLIIFIIARMTRPAFALSGSLSNLVNMIGVTCQ